MRNVQASIGLRAIGYVCEIAAVFVMLTNRRSPGVLYTAYALFAIGFAFILAAYLPWGRRASGGAVADKDQRPEA